MRRSVPLELLSTVCIDECDEKIFSLKNLASGVQAARGCELQSSIVNQQPIMPTRKKRNYIKCETVVSASFFFKN